MRYEDLFPHQQQIAELWMFIDFGSYSVFLPQVPTQQELDKFRNAIDRVKSNPASGRGETCTAFAQIIVKHGFGVLGHPELDTVVKSWMDLPDLESGHSVREAFRLVVSVPMVKGIENLPAAPGLKRDLLDAWKGFLERNLPIVIDPLAPVNEWVPR